MVKKESSPSLPQGTRDVIEYSRRHPEEFRLITESFAEIEAERANRQQSPQSLLLLQSRIKSLLMTHSFSPGDLVVWKEGLRNKVRPAVGEIAVVVEFRSQPAINPRKEPSSPYYLEPLDLALAVVDEDDEVLIYHFDSRRFQPASDPKDSSVGSAD